MSRVAFFDAHPSLIAKYFDSVDPVYPMIHRHSFQKDYDHFWSLSVPKRNEVKGDLVALIFVMLAMGTQFVSLPALDGKEQTAEFMGKNTASFHVPPLLIRVSIRITPSSTHVVILEQAHNAHNSSYGPCDLLSDERQPCQRRLGFRWYTDPSGLRNGS